MEKNVNHIDKLFKNKLNNHRVEPPAHLWNNISQELDKVGEIDDIFKKSLYHNEVNPPAYVWDNINTTLSKLENRRKSRIWWMFGSGAAVIVAFIAGYFIANSIQNTPENQPVAIASQEQKQSANKHYSVEENSVINKKKENHHLNLSSLENTDQNTSSEVETMHLLSANESKNSNSNQKGFKNTGNKETPVLAKTTNTIIGNSGSNKKPTDKFSANQSGERNNVLLSDDSNHKNKQTEALPTVNEQVIFEIEKQDSETTGSSQNTNLNDHTDIKNTQDDQQIIDLYEGLDPVSSYYPLFSVSLFFSPMYANSNSFNDENKYDPIMPSTDDRFNYTTLFSYQAGLLLGYNFTRNISLHIGCSYNQISHSTGRGQLQTIPYSQASIYDSALTIQTSAGELTGISVDPNLDNQEEGPTINIEQTLLQNPIQRVVQTIGFIEVPVLIKYRLATSRVGFLFTGGLSSGFIVRNDAFAENQTEYVRFGETANIRNVNFNFVLGTGVDVQVTPWMYFTFEPTFRYSMLNWSTKEDVKINPIMIGANTGLSFRF